MLICSSAYADRGTASPDFVGNAPKRHIPASLVASDRTEANDPYDVVAFANDEARMLDSGFAQVDSAARWLKAHPRHYLVLEGHTDAIGRDGYNEDLATQRVATVRGRLLRDGIASDRIVMITYGEREARSPDNINDRRVVMYATTIAPQAVVAMTREHRDAIVATWTQGGQLMQMERKLTVPTKTVAGRK